MKLTIFSLLLIAACCSLEASPCDDCSAGCALPPQCALKGFNVKRALYQKFPLLYKIYETKCKLYCNKLNGGACSCSSPAIVSEAPAFAPPPPPESPLQVPLPPEIARALLAGQLQPEGSCPCCS